jgi:hypothetical protein
LKEKLLSSTITFKKIQIYYRWEMGAELNVTCSTNKGNLLAETECPGNTVAEENSAI